MIRYSVAEVASLMNMTPATLIAEVEEATTMPLDDIFILTDMVVPIGTVNINNQQYFFGYQAEEYAKNENIFYNHIVLSTKCSNAKWNINQSPCEQQVVMAMQIDESFMKRYGLHIIWLH